MSLFWFWVELCSDDFIAWRDADRNLKYENNKKFTHKHEGFFLIAVETNKQTKPNIGTQNKIKKKITANPLKEIIFDSIHTI